MTLAKTQPPLLIAIVTMCLFFHTKWWSLPWGVHTSRTDTCHEQTETGERTGCGAFLYWLITIILDTATDNQGLSSRFTQTGFKPKTLLTETTDLPAMEPERQVSHRTWQLTLPKLIPTQTLESCPSYQAFLGARQILFSVASICCSLSLGRNWGGKLRLALF